MALVIGISGSFFNRGTLRFYYEALQGKLQSALQRRKIYPPTDKFGLGTIRFHRFELRLMAQQIAGIGERAGKVGGVVISIDTNEAVGAADESNGHRAGGPRWSDRRRSLVAPPAASLPISHSRTVPSLPG